MTGFGPTLPNPAAQRASAIEGEADAQRAHASALRKLAQGVVEQNG